MSANPQPSRDDREPQDITDLDTSRLALRGAVESLRSLQEVNQRLKGEIQEYANRNKLLDQRLITIQTDLNVSNAKLDRQEDLYQKKENELRRNIRQEVSLEENQRWQAEMAALRQSIEMWKAAREQKEAELERLNKVLADKESDILSLQKEKVIVQGKANQDLATSLAKSREDLKLAVEAVILEKDKQLQVLKVELQDEIAELQIHLRAKEKEAQLKDENVAKHFHERHQELSQFWAKREQEIWDRAKQAKEAMEAGLKERWDARLETLTKEFAEKTFLQEQNYANLLTQLEQQEQALKNRLQGEEANLRENFVKKTGDMEQSYVERSAALEMQWNAREKEFTHAHRKALDAERVKFNEEVRKAKEEASAWMVTRDADFHAKQTELRVRHQGLEKELRETWGKREELLTLRHAEEIKKTQDTLTQTLRDKLGAAAESYAKQVENLQLHLAELDKKGLDQETELRALRDRTTIAEKERAQMVQMLDTREAAARKLLEDKEKTWTITHEALRKHSLETAQKAFEEIEAQKLRIAELEKQDADAKAKLIAQHDRIQGLDKERTALSETLQEREAALHNELDTKQREWAAANEALRAQFSTLTSESVRRSETHRGRISDLEKQCESQAAEFSVLHKQHLKLETERAQIADTLKHREVALLAEIDLKQREWKTVNAALQEQLTRLNTESGRTNEAQQARIADLERQSQEAQSQVKILQQKLQALEKERATLADAIAYNESSFRKQLEDREGEWAALNGSLQEQLAALTRETSQKIETLQELASGLEKQKTEIAAHARSLENQLQNLQREHGQLGETLRVREAALLKELEVKRAEWRAVQETLQDQLKKVTGESAQRNEVQLGRIADLETRQLEARSEIKLLQQKIQHFEEERTRLLSDIEAQGQQAIQRQEHHQAQVTELERLNAEARAHLQELQEKLHSVQQERESLAEALAVRETALKKQIEEKELALASNKEAHQRQIDILKRDAFKKDESQQAQIAHLEKERADIKAQWMSLRERLHNLEKTRQDTADKLDMQEKAYRMDLADKERAWTVTRDALQEQLASQSKTSALESATQQARIAELEKRAADAETHVVQLKEKLQALDQEHAALSLTLQDREAALVLHLEDKGREWARKEDALNEKLAVLAREANQKQQAQQTAIVTLEERGKQAAALTQDLKEKMDALTKERDHAAEKLRVRETTLSKELADKELAWTRTHDDLREQLLKLKKSSSGESTAQQARIGELEKQIASEDKYIIGLKEKLHAVDQEKIAQAQSFQGRERDLQALMDEKTRSWSLAKEALEEKLKILTRESTETYQTQKALIADLEAGRKDASAQIAALQEKLSQVSKDRDTTSETLKGREGALQKELTEKENAWARAEQALQEALASQKKASIQDSAVKDSRITELEKKSADAETYIQTLREKLQLLDKERTTLSLSLQNRERDLRQQLENKEQAWTLAKETLQEKLSALELQSTRTQQGQKESILELENRQKQAAELIAALQQKLNEVENDRDTKTDTLRVREASLNKELLQKQAAWEKIQFELQEELAQLRKSSSLESTAQRERIEVLQKQNLASDGAIAGLREKLQILDQERLAQAQAFQVRERNLLLEIDDKTRNGTQIRDALEDQLKALTRESTQIQQAQKALIGDLEARQKEAKEVMASLQARLDQVGQDRDTTKDTLRVRESALHKELKEKELAWARAEQALKEALDAQQKTAFKEGSAKDSRIQELEKNAADAEKYIHTLRDKLQGLDKERIALSLTLQNRERDLRQQLDEKEHAWVLTKDALQEKLGALELQSAQTQQNQKEMILELQGRQKESADLVAALQQKLDAVEKDRDVKSDTLRVREAALHKELTHKQAVWEKGQNQLQEELALLRKSSSVENAAQRERILELEKQNAAANASVTGLREKLLVLDTERAAQAQAFQMKERNLLLEIDEKTRTWTQVKDALEEKLKIVSRESAQALQVQKALTADLDVRQKESAELIASLQAKLDGVEEDRDTTADTLRVRESALQKELAHKQALWEKTQSDLQEQLAQVKKSAGLESAEQQERIGELRRYQSEANAALVELREKLQSLDKERILAIQSAQARERDLQQQIDEKSHAWTRIKETLDAQLKESVHSAQQAQLAQKTIIADLDLRQKDASVQLSNLHEKLAAVEKERDLLADRLHQREATLQKDLSEKQQTWQDIREDLQEQLAKLKNTSSLELSAQQARIADLEKQNAAAEKQIALLRDKGHVLDKERATLSTVFRDKESQLRQQLDENTQAWLYAKGALEEKLNTLSRESAQTQKLQHGRIADLEKFVAAAAAEMEGVREKLSTVQSERDALAESLRVREKALRGEMTEKEQIWEKTRGELEVQLAGASGEVVRQREEQKLQLAALQKRNAEALALIQTLQAQLEAVRVERETVSDTLKTREAALRDELERKQKDWTGAKQALQEQIETLNQDQARRAAVQQSEFHALEKRSTDAETQARQLREKLQGIDKDRRALVDNFEARQNALREELEDKERGWAASAENLKEQLAALKRDASKKDQGQHAQITALERQNADAKLQVTALRDQLGRLEQERFEVSRKLEAREQAFRAELEEKERLSQSAREALEAQWAAFRNEVQQKTMNRENRIFELEKLSAAAALEAQTGREQLQKLEAERAAQLDAVRSREILLRKELAEKEQSWNRVQRDLQDQFAALSSESTRVREEQQARISDLSRRNGEAEDHVRTLQSKIQDLEKEREALTGNLNHREAALKAQLDKKQLERDDYKEQLSELKLENTRLDEGRKGQIAELQKQAAAAEEHAEALRGKLRQIEKERESLNESLRGRERSYAKELEQKQRESDAARDELQSQLTRLRKESSQKQELQKAQITDVERAFQDAQTTLQALRERVRILEKERDALKEDVDQRENNLEKRRAALEKTIRQREQDLEQRTTRLEEELRQTWIGKERELGERVQLSFEKEQAAFQDKLRDFQEHSQEQLSKLQNDQQEAQRHKKELEQQKAEQTARFEQRDRALREREEKTRDEARRQLTQLESERSGWDERLRQMEAEQSDLQKRQAQVQSREQEIDRLREQLTASLDAPSGKSGPGVQSLVEEWVFGFAHQVRNPLGIIRSMTESMMNTRVSGKDQRESFGAILQAVDGLARRLGEFIDFSKPVKVVLRNTVLADVANNALTMVQSAAAHQTIQIHKRYDDKTPVMMLDPEQLQTALQHLFTNAFEAMPHGGNLTVEVKPDGAGAVLRIQDSGSGISAAHMKEIGKPFFSTKTGRIGLGLAGAKRILHSLGGELHFDSRLGQGTSVTCRFKTRGK